MPSVFRLSDRRYLADAVAQGFSHGDQTLFETGLGIRTEGTRAQRGSALVQHLFDKVDEPDAAVVDLLNFLYVESAGAAFRLESDAFATLQARVLDPHGVALTDDGFRLPALGSSPDRRPPSAVSQTTEVPLPANAPRASVDASRVFVVHGRDQRPIQVLEQFLMFVGLRMMPWSEARSLTASPQPTTYDIVRAGMGAAAAIVVVFSPDDLAQLDPSLDPSSPPEPPRGQARQNVLLEAGMAFASAPRKTIFVMSAPTRPITDISGFNWVNLDGKWDSRQDLVNRLRDAGAAVSASPGDLRAPLAGAFKVI